MKITYLQLKQLTAESYDYERDDSPNSLRNSHSFAGLNSQFQQVKIRAMRKALENMDIEVESTCSEQQ